MARAPETGVWWFLSDAGKPVWSRYGDAANLSGFAAALGVPLASASEQLYRSSVDASERSVANERVVSFTLDGEAQRQARARPHDRLRRRA